MPIPLRQAALPLLLVLAACKTPVEAELYTADLAQVIESGLPIEAPLTVFIPMPGDEKCAEIGGTLAPALAQGFTNPVFKACDQVDMDNYAIYTAEAPVTPEGTVGGDTILAFTVAGGLGELRLTATASPAALDRVAKALDAAGLSTGGEPIEPQLSVTINNDMPGPVSLSFRDVFADGHPVAVETERELERRDAVKFTLSDVGNAALSLGEPAVPVATLALD